jgi:hypothetical protein
MDPSPSPFLLICCIRAIDEMIAPYLGGDDPIFGTLFQGSGLPAFFDATKMNSIRQAVDAGSPSEPSVLPSFINGATVLFIHDCQTTIIYGCGAALAAPKGSFIVYVDLPKNEIQYRSRAGSITNIGASKAADPKTMYKVPVLCLCVLVGLLYL